MLQGAQVMQDGAGHRDGWFPSGRHHQQLNLQLEPQGAGYRADTKQARSEGHQTGQAATQLRDGLRLGNKIAT